jgi:phenylpropionate dioxygenase-like ring-hydroxylating dioxygenase large terminal subunit
MNHLPCLRLSPPENRKHGPQREVGRHAGLRGPVVCPPREPVDNHSQISPALVGLRQQVACQGRQTRRIFTQDSFSRKSAQTVGLCFTQEQTAGKRSHMAWTGSPSFGQWLSQELNGAEDALAEGWSLPHSLQGSDALLEFEQAHVFGKGWALAGRAADWPTVGARRVLTVGGVPLVVVRDAAGELSAFVNICRHRGHPLVAEGDRAGPLLGCRYHGWSYDLEGRLVAAPGLELCAKTAEALALQPIRVELWCGLVFVGLSSDAPPLSGEFAPAAGAPAEAMISSYQEHGRSRLTFAADWKRVQDNVVECYHCAGVHSRTLERMYRADAFQEAGWQGRCRYGTAELRDLPGVHHSIQLFPGTLVFLDPVMGLLARIHPERPDLTVMDVIWLVAPDADAALADRFIDLWSRTLAEDQAILAAQHAALASGRLARGRLVAGREDAVAGAQRLVLAAYRTGLAA